MIQYKVVRYFDMTPSNNDEEFNKALNRLANDNWELITVYGDRFIFKRKI